MFTFTVVTYKLPLGEAGIAVAIVGLIVQRERIRWPPLVWLYVAFVAWAFVTSFASPFQEIVRQHVIDQAKLGIIMFVAVNALTTRARLRAFVIFFLACFTLFPDRGTLVSYALGSHPFGRAVWNFIYKNSNDLAALCLLALGTALSLATIKSERKMVRLGAIVSASLSFTVILLTQSRGVFAGLLVTLIPMTMKAVVQKARRAVYVALLVALVVALTPASVWQRYAGMSNLTSVSTISAADPEGSAEQRWEIQKTGWRIFIDRPLLGVGLGAYPIANGLYSPELGRRDTHNSYLNLAAELGLPGLLLWLAMVVTVMVGARRARLVSNPQDQPLQQIWLERAMVGFLVAGAVGTYAKLTFPYLMLALLWCSASLTRGAADRRAPAGSRMPSYAAEYGVDALGNSPTSPVMRG